MIRLPNIQGKSIIGHLLVLRSRFADRWLVNDLVNDVTRMLNRGEISRETYLALVDRDEGTILDWMNLDQFIEQSIEQLKEGNDQAVPELLDVLAKILGSPYALNVLSGQYVRDLRNAILRPEEIKKLSRAIPRCVDCGHPFVEGEIVTFQHNGHETILLCSRCQPPQTQACSQANCDSVVPLGDIARQQISASCQCAKCKEGKKKEVEPLPPDVNPFEAFGGEGGLDGELHRVDPLIFRAPGGHVVRAGRIRPMRLGDFNDEGR